MRALHYLRSKCLRCLNRLVLRFPVWFDCFGFLRYHHRLPVLAHPVRQQRRSPSLLLLLPTLEDAIEARIPNPSDQQKNQGPTTVEENQRSRESPCQKNSISITSVNLNLLSTLESEPESEPEQFQELSDREIQCRSFSRQHRARV